MSYGGFYIEKPVGNNKFSYDLRNNKRIFVSELISKNLNSTEFRFCKFDFIEVSNRPNFIEIDEIVEKECFGLKNMYEINLVDENNVVYKKIYIFDNHNHAFYFWCKSINENFIKKGLMLLHVDQHKDTREPDNFDVDIENMYDVSRYTNEVLNVGNFIKPAMYYDIFSELSIVDSEYGLKRDINNDYILDLDLDFFSRDMDYIDLDFKINRVREYIGNAKLITVATSPFFIEQDRAIDIFKKLFSVENSCGL